MAAGGEKFDVGECRCMYCALSGMVIGCALNIVIIFLIYKNCEKIALSTSVSQLLKGVLKFGINVEILLREVIARRPLKGNNNGNVNGGIKLMRPGDHEIILNTTISYSYQYSAKSLGGKFIGVIMYNLSDDARWPGEVTRRGVLSTFKYLDVVLWYASKGSIKINK